MWNWMDPGTTNAKNACWVQNWVHKIEHKTFKISIQRLLWWLNMFLKPFCIVLQVPCNNKYHQMDICMICQNDFLLWIPPILECLYGTMNSKNWKRCNWNKSSPSFLSVSNFFFVRALCGTFQKAIKNCTIRCPILGWM